MWIKTAWSFLTSNLAIAGGAILAIFYGIIKYQSGKIEDLEHENKVKDKINEIREEQDEITEEILKHEDKRIKDKIKANSGKSRRDRASRL